MGHERLSENKNKKGIIYPHLAQRTLYSTER